jgi:hypothetical protein
MKTKLISFLQKNALAIISTIIYTKINYPEENLIGFIPTALGACLIPVAIGYGISKFIKNDVNQTIGTTCVIIYILSTIGNQYLQSQ